LPVILFSGYFKNTGDLPEWIGWVQYVSPITYSFNILVHN
jgi:ATP-binding cassette, subfamily G (WHITE), eye pigment precursor transporter